MTIQTLIHYFLHLGAPFFLAVICFGTDWKKAYWVMLATMLVDIDHIFADPVFMADRCSIGTHPLHSWYAGILYLGLIFLKKPYRFIGVGLLFHLFTDIIDCFFMFDKCGSCHEGNPLYEIWKIWLA